MLPTSARPEIPGYDLVLAYRPAYMVTRRLPMISSIGQTGGVAAFVGDGSGHGPAACLLVATMRTILRIHPDQHTDPGPTLSFAGRTLAPLISSGEFMTGVYLVLRKGKAESPGPRLVTTLPLGSVPLVGSPPLT